MRIAVFMFFTACAEPMYATATARNAATWPADVRGSTCIPACGMDAAMLWDGKNRCWCAREVMPHGLRALEKVSDEWVDLCGR